MSTSASGTPVATLVKAANVTGVRTGTPQQIRQLALHPQILAQRKLAGQKVAAQLGKGGMQTQLIVQPTKPLPVSMQQIQQVIKQVQPPTVQQFPHVRKILKNYKNKRDIFSSIFLIYYNPFWCRCRERKLLVSLLFRYSLLLARFFEYLS